MSLTKLLLLLAGLLVVLFCATVVTLLVVSTPKLNPSDDAEQEMHQTLKEERDKKSTEIGRKAFRMLDEKYGRDSGSSDQWSY